MSINYDNLLNLFLFFEIYVKITRRGLQMIIGIDIDGVLTDLMKSCKKEYSKFSKLKNGRKVFNKRGNSLGEIFGVSREEDEEFWDGFLWGYSENGKYYSSAGKYLKRLKEDGHTLVVVTSRAFAGRNDELGQKMRENIEKSFIKNGIVYDKTVYTSEMKSKIPAIHEHGAQVMIDDSAWNLKELSQHIPTICFDQLYNRRLKLENMTRAKSWKDVYKIINQMSKMKG